MTLLIIFAFASGLFLSFSNGANDNFKGVATLLGSKTTNYKVALSWATITTLAGSLTAFFLAEKLMKNFSGKGLVPDDVIVLAAFPVSVALAAALTVFLATRLGFPISTTHALTGGLVGSGLVASAGSINLAKLGSSFFLPLLISPFLAIALTTILYPVFRYSRKRLGVQRESCLCIGNQILVTAPASVPKGTTSALLQIGCCPEITVGTQVTCEERYVGKVMGINAKNVLDTLHFISAGVVSFARGLNDTPKIAAILLSASAVSSFQSAGYSHGLSIGLVALAMAIGGLVMAKSIANTMSYRITEMNDGQGFTGNLVTGLVVLGASHLGMPVSTTHVSCGSLFGIGTVTKQAHWGSIAKIVLSWIITLPVAGLLGALLFLVMRGIV